MYHEGPTIEELTERRVRCMRCESRKFGSCYYRVRTGRRSGPMACQQIKRCLKLQDPANRSEMPNS